jgi:hypothetical protein
MKIKRKSSTRPEPSSPRKIGNSSADTALAISKKLLEIKRVSGACEMTELNMALFRHLK